MAIDLVVGEDDIWLASDGRLAADPQAVRYFPGPALLEIDFGDAAPAQLLDREVDADLRPRFAGATAILVAIVDPQGAALEAWRVPLLQG